MSMANKSPVILSNKPVSTSLSENNNLFKGTKKHNYTMGRIKGALIKRTARTMMKAENKFTNQFNDNKNILGGSMPSKKLRNQIAGYITRIKKNTHKIIETPESPELH